MTDARLETNPAPAPPAENLPTEPAARPSARRGGWLWTFARSNRAGAIGLAVITTYIVVAILAPVLAPKDPTEVFPQAILTAPSADFPFGTDANGMDVLSRVIHGARIDLLIAVTAVSLSLVAGSLLGLFAGYRGGWVDLVLLRTMDVLQAFPVLILALAVVAATTQSISTVIVVIAFVDAPIYTRLIRAQTQQIRESTYIESARAVGNPTWRILIRHVLPNALPPVLVQSAIRVSWAIKITASLAFVGVGIQVPTPEWGAMIRAGAGQVANGQWWASVFPGIAMLVLAFGFNLLADGLQEHVGRRDA